MLWYVLVSVAMVGYCNGQGEFEEKCSINFHSIAGKCYQFYQRTATWLAAEGICEEVGAHLASVKTDQEYSDILQHIHDNYDDRYWIAGSLVGGNWIWTTDGSPMKADWFGRTPVTSGNYCAYFCSYTRKYWDGECTLQKKFICQRDELIDRIDPRFQTGEDEISTNF